MNLENVRIRYILVTEAQPAFIISFIWRKYDGTYKRNTSCGTQVLQQRGI